MSFQMALLFWYKQWEKKCFVKRKGITNHLHINSIVKWTRNTLKILAVYIFQHSTYADYKKLNQLDIAEKSRLHFCSSIIKHISFRYRISPVSVPHSLQYWPRCWIWRQALRNLDCGLTLLAFSAPRKQRIRKVLQSAVRQWVA